MDNTSIKPSLSKYILEDFLLELRVVETHQQIFDIIGSLGFKMCNELSVIAQKVRSFTRK